MLASRTGEGLDVAYDGYRKACRSGGIVVKGIHASAAQQRSVQQTPYLEEYRFVPYKDDNAAKEQRYQSAHGLVLVGLKSNNLSSLLLFRKCSTAADVSKQDVVRVNNTEFEWIETLKEKAHSSTTLSRPERTSGYLPRTMAAAVSSASPIASGWKQVDATCVFDASHNGRNEVSDFSPGNLKYADILQRDLVMNVYRDGQWGSYRHLCMTSGGPKKTTFAFLGIHTRGDLSTLQWYESPLKYASFSGSSANNGILCDVYYAPLNLRDELLATGKVAPDPMPGQGRRVMAVAPSQAMATVAMTDPDFTWQVPETWSLEEACTVPLAYLTAYYALILRGNMQPGESGSDPLWQRGTSDRHQSPSPSLWAAPYSPLSVVGVEGAVVVVPGKEDIDPGSAQERKFLKRRFPELEDRHFASFRDLSFEAHVLGETKGRGVDLLLNSLAEDKLKANVRCLADRGRFLEIGQFTQSKNSPLGMSALRRNVTFHGIMMDKMLVGDSYSAAVKRRLFEMVRDGIDSGVVRPLDTVLFTRDKIDEAFRFLASGKHIGKVVIQIRPEEAHHHGAPAVPLAVEAIARPCFYGHKSYVIAGGLGGFGLELADWMVTRGCRKLLLTSRSGLRTGYQKLCLHRWRAAGVQVLAINSDVAADEGARMIIEEAASMGPVGGIFNLTMVLRDALIENQTVETFEAACLAIQWGTVGDVGLMNESLGDNTVLRGLEPQKIRSCIAVMDQFLSQGCPVVTSYVKASQSRNLGDEEKQDLIQYVGRILGKYE
ncbi:hypothetical protein MTO96_040288 [Rhipicephalus appendiculatus]